MSNNNKYQQFSPFKTKDQNLPPTTPPVNHTKGKISVLDLLPEEIAQLVKPDLPLLKCTLLQTELETWSKEKLIRQLKEFNVRAINSEQETLAWIEKWKTLKQEGQNLYQMYLERCQQIKRSRIAFKEQKENFHQLHSNCVEKDAEIKLLGEEKAALIFEQEQEKLKIQQTHDIEKSQLQQTHNIEKNQFREELETLRAENEILRQKWNRGQEEQADLSLRVLERNREFDTMSRDFHEFRQFHEEVHSKHSEHVSDLLSTIHSLQSRLEDAESARLHQGSPSPLRKLETMTIRAEALRARNDELEAKLRLLRLHEESRLALEREVKSLTAKLHAKESQLQQVQSEAEEKIRTIREQFREEMTQERADKNHLNELVTKSSQTIREKEELLEKTELQKVTVDSLKEKNSELTRMLAERNIFTKNLENDIRLLYQQHKHDLKAVDEKYRHEDYKKNYTRVLGEKKCIEEKLATALSIISRFPTLPKTCHTLVGLLSTGTKGMALQCDLLRKEKLDVEEGRRLLAAQEREIAFSKQSLNEQHQSLENASTTLTNQEKIIYDIVSVYLSERMCVEAFQVHTASLQDETRALEAKLKVMDALNQSMRERLTFQEFFVVEQETKFKAEVEKVKLENVRLQGVLLSNGSGEDSHNLQVAASFNGEVMAQKSTKECSSHTIKLNENQLNQFQLREKMLVQELTTLQEESNNLKSLLQSLKDEYEQKMVAADLLKSFVGHHKSLWLSWLNQQRNSTNNNDNNNSEKKLQK